MHYFTLRQESEPISVCCNILYHEDEQSILGIWTALSRSRNGRGTRGGREREREERKKGEYEKKGTMFGAEVSHLGRRYLERA